MVRRLKSLQRSRRTPLLVPPPGPNRETPLPPAPGPPPPVWSDPWAEAAQDLPGEEFSPSPAPTPLPRPTATAPLPPPTPLPPPPSGHAPTGWDWFAQWSFPTQLFLFAVLTAAGMWWLERRPEPPPPPPAAAAARPAAKPRPPLRPEIFDWLNRLRETQVVTNQLETEFTEAQEFYRQYALDEFLDFDPWSLATDEVITLNHFCDHGFFTVEREILVKILERKVLSDPDTRPPAGSGAAARLVAAAVDRETRLSNLREAAELYRRGRATEITLPGTLTPEEDQARRAKLVDRLAAVRRERTRLDQRIAELNAMLR